MPENASPTAKVYNKVEAIKKLDGFDSSLSWMTVGVVLAIIVLTLSLERSNSTSEAKLILSVVPGIGLAVIFALRITSGYILGAIKLVLLTRE